MGFIAPSAQSRLQSQDLLDRGDVFFSPSTRPVAFAFRTMRFNTNPPHLFSRTLSASPGTRSRKGGRLSARPSGVGIGYCLSRRPEEELTS